MFYEVTVEPESLEADQALKTSDLLYFFVAEVEMLQTRALVKTAHRFDLVRAQPESFQKFAFVYSLQSTTVKLANT